MMIVLESALKAVAAELWRRQQPDPRDTLRHEHAGYVFIQEHYAEPYETGHAATSHAFVPTLRIECDETPLLSLYRDQVGSWHILGGGGWPAPDLAAIVAAGTAVCGG